MSEETKNYEQSFANIMNNLAESVIDISDDELTDEIKAEGDNSKRVEQILLGAVKSCRQKKLLEARKRYEQSALRLQEQKHLIPDAPSERRDMLQSLITRASATQQSQLTAQFQDFKSLPDEDLEGYLTQLIELGLLYENSEQDEV
jgi:hypothetical protein